MEKHLRMFDTHSEYEEYINSQDKLLPNVSYCKNQEKIHYNPLDYSKDYLTFVALDDCTFKFTPPSYYSLVSNSIDYSIDGGNTWETLEPNEESPMVTAGNKIMWKSTTLKNDGTSGSGNFQSSGHYIAQGNIMSLLYGDEFERKTVINKGNVFGYLFSRSDRELIDVTNLILPATTLSDSCYLSMFQGCANLTTAPKLPATILANRCYEYMFKDCYNISLIECLATDISATNCTYKWLDNNNVRNGTFIKNKEMLDWPTGTGGIPEGWTVENV